METKSNGNTFYFTQEKPLQGEARINDDIITSKAFKEVVEKSKADPAHLYRVVIDQGYLSDEDFKVAIRYYNANIIYQDLPSNLVISYTGNQEAIDDGYVPEPFVDADKEWFKKFKAACEENPNVMFTIEIAEGNRERGDFLDYVFRLSENLPDNARVVKVYNKEHDQQLLDSLKDRFKPINFEFDPETAHEIAKDPNNIQLMNNYHSLFNSNNEKTTDTPQELLSDGETQIRR